MSDPIIAEFELKNPMGLHARPAAMIVRTLNKYTCVVTVEKDGERVNCKSLMSLLMLSAGMGAVLKFTAEGDDADEALKALEEIIVNKFYEV